MTGVKSPEIGDGSFIDYKPIAPKAPEGDFDLRKMIPGDGALELDIGFGRGASLFHRAEGQPGHRIVGIEIKAKWAYKVEERRKREKIENLCVLCGDAREILARVQPGAVADLISMHFPDPWWKKRHARRRLADEPFLNECARILRPGGFFFLQTDVEDRAAEATEVVEANPHFEVQRSLRENPFAAPSNRETRASADGLPIYRVLAQRSP